MALSPTHGPCRLVRQVSKIGQLTLPAETRDDPSRLIRLVKKIDQRLTLTLVRRRRCRTSRCLLDLQSDRMPIVFAKRSDVKTIPTRSIGANRLVMDRGRDSSG